jgi:hypothetical protein
VQLESSHRSARRSVMCDRLTRYPARPAWHCFPSTFIRVTHGGLGALRRATGQIFGNGSFRTWICCGAPGFKAARKEGAPHGAVDPGGRWLCRHRRAVGVSFGRATERRMDGR